MDRALGLIRELMERWCSFRIEYSGDCIDVIYSWHIDKSSASSRYDKEECIDVIIEWLNTAFSITPTRTYFVNGNDRYGNIETVWKINTKGCLNG